MVPNAGIYINLMFIVITIPYKIMLILTYLDEGHQELHLLILALLSHPLINNNIDNLEVNTES